MTSPQTILEKTYNQDDMLKSLINWLRVRGFAARLVAWRSQVLKCGGGGVHSKCTPLEADTAMTPPRTVHPHPLQGAGAP